MSLNLPAVREWAAANGKAIGARGRLPKSVIAEFLVAHPRTLRDLAAHTNVAVGKRGRVTQAQALAVIEADSAPAPVIRDPYLLNV